MLTKGHFINELKRNPNANSEIRELCKELVKKWKEDISPPASAADVNKTSAPSSVASPSESGESTTIERTVTSDKLYFSSKRDKGISDRSNLMLVRDRCVEMLYAALATGSTKGRVLPLTVIDGNMILEMALTIENITQSRHEDNQNQYKARIRSLVSNLKDKKNHLRLDILKGKISPEDFAGMTTTEMMSSQRKQEVEEARKASMFEAVAATQTHATTDMFKCGKCHQRKTTYYQMQTRSADEPMTTFVTCVNCDNRWKFC